MSIHPPVWSIERFELLRFEQRQDSVDCWLKMPGSYWVKESTFRLTWKLFWRSAHLLDSNLFYTARALCNDPKWDLRPKGQRIAMGRSIKHMAINEVLPIVLASNTAPLKYSPIKELLGLRGEPPRILRRLFSLRDRAV